MNSKYNSNCQTAESCNTVYDIRTTFKYAMAAASELTGDEAKSLLCGLLRDLNYNGRSISPDALESFWFHHSQLSRFSPGQHVPASVNNGSHLKTEDTPQQPCGQSVPTSQPTSKFHDQRTPDQY